MELECSVENFTLKSFSSVHFLFSSAIESRWSREGQRATELPRPWPALSSSGLTEGSPNPHGVIIL